MLRGRGSRVVTFEQMISVAFLDKLATFEQMIFVAIHTHTHTHTPIRDLRVDSPS
jgi:hypothetical protein